MRRHVLHKLKQLFEFFIEILRGFVKNLATLTRQYNSIPGSFFDVISRTFHLVPTKGRPCTGILANAKGDDNDIRRQESVRQHA